MLDAEASLRTLHAYVSILQGRLALARVSGSRHEFDGIADGQLAQVAMLCANATHGIHAMLDRMAPELASTAAAVAEVNCQRELELRASPAHLRLVPVDADLPAS